MSIVIPNLARPLVDIRSGMVMGQSEWVAYLTQFVDAPTVPIVLTVGTGVAYKAKEPGNIILSGGTVSNVVLRRGKISVNLTGIRIIPVEIKDYVTVTYTGGTVIQFWPRY